MPTAPTPIDPLGTPPSTTDPANFDSRADALFVALPNFVAQTNAVALNVKANADEAAARAGDAAGSASAAAAAQTAAATNAAAAAANAGAAAWVSGTMYSVGAKVFSGVDGRVYRRLSAGAGTTDPAGDAANWEDILNGRRIRITGATALVVRAKYELDSSGGPFSVTLPATFADTDWIDFVDVGASLSANPVTVLRNGNQIRRVAEDLVLDVSGDALRLTARTSLGWIEE